MSNAKPQSDGKFIHWQYIALPVILASAIVLAGCSMEPKGRANPFDPLNPETGADPINLTASLVDYAIDSTVVKKVQLAWCNVVHSDLDEYHVYRKLATDIEARYGLIGTVEPGGSSFLDVEGDVSNCYYYQVWLILESATDSIPSSQVISPRLR